MYDKKLYRECVDGKSGKWCPTSLNPNQTTKTWAYCLPKGQKPKSSKKFVFK
ncbi:hypothetical protein [Winogradskyella sp.]|uniref:hypothetical protein n=1 Tax=Winogradskyella sp. TaxID=1883156 RepID=UPI003F697926